MQNIQTNSINNTPSRLVRLGLQAYYALDKASRSVSFVSEAALAFMMFLTAADVLLRYIFSMPITGAYELTEYAMAVFVGAGIAYTGIVKGHVDVDVLVSKLAPKTQAIFACFTGILSSALFALITWNTFIFMRNVISLNTTSAALLIPVFPFVVIVGCGCGLLTLVILAQLVQSFYKAITL
jgi:TRAP-type C4-dicarboxylate transport system permease small subunit